MGQIVSNITSAWAAPLQYKQDKARVWAAREMQAAGNEREAAVASLKTKLQTLANKSRMDAGGEQITALSTNAARFMDSWLNGSINQQVQASEAVGALAVGTAAAGQGGGSVELIKRTMQATITRGEALSDKRRGQVEQDAVDRQKGIMRDTILGLDNSQHFANLDYTRYVDPQKPAKFMDVAIQGFFTGGFAWDLNAARNQMVSSAMNGQVQQGAAIAGQRIGETMATVGKAIMTFGASTAVDGAAATSMANGGGMDMNNLNSWSQFQYKPNMGIA